MLKLQYLTEYIGTYGVIYYLFTLYCCNLYSHACFTLGNKYSELISLVRLQMTVRMMTYHRPNTKQLYNFIYKALSPCTTMLTTKGFVVNVIVCYKLTVRI